MLISAHDKKLLNDYQVQIDIDSKQKCGFIKIQNRDFKVTLLTRPSGSDDATWIATGLAKEQMKEAASKVAVMLLKKELIQTQSPSKQLSEFKIHNQGFTTNLPNKKEIDHEDPIENKNTRPDYDALMNYLSSAIEEDEDNEIDSDQQDEIEDEMDVQLEIDEINPTIESIQKHETLSHESQVKKEELKESQLDTQSRKKKSIKVHSAIPRPLSPSFTPSYLWKKIFGWLPHSLNLFDPIHSILPAARKYPVKALKAKEDTIQTSSSTHHEEESKTAQKRKGTVKKQPVIDSQTEGRLAFDWQKYWNNRQHNQQYDQRCQSELFERFKKRGSFSAFNKGNLHPSSRKKWPAVTAPLMFKPLESETTIVSSQSPASPKPMPKLRKPLIMPGNEDEISYYHWKKAQQQRLSPKLETPKTSAIKPLSHPSVKKSVVSSQNDFQLKMMVDSSLNPFI